MSAPATLTQQPVLEPHAAPRRRLARATRRRARPRAPSKRAASVAASAESSGASTLDLAQHADVGDADAVRRQHAGQRMDDDGLDAERFGDLRRVLTAGAAEAAEREARDVVAALHGDLLDRVGHALDGDAHEARRRPARGSARSPVARADVARQRRERRARGARVERLVGVRAEHARKEVGLDAAEQQVRVGHRQRPAASVARRPRQRARRLRARP